MAKVAILGVSGSVACYRAADLARELMRRGFEVRVCLTEAAREFVSPKLFEALTGNPCLDSVSDEPVAGRMAHIDWARQASVLVAAPATANLISRLAYGEAPDMFTAIALASTAPLVVAPAMNPTMYSSEPTAAAMAILRSRATAVVEPLEGDVACGEHGQGKLASIDAIAEAVTLIADRAKVLEGKRVLITSGPTQEPLDSVRYLSNRSSGKMGAALARAAQLLGAEVTVVSGPAAAALPHGVNVIRVRTALQMHESVLAEITNQDWIIGAAAVADYRPAKTVEGKLRRTEEMSTLEMVANPDIIAAAAKHAGPNAKVIGFAAEPTSDLEVARQKLQRKGLHALALNDITRADAGFESETNELTLLLPEGTPESSGLMGKLGCALWLLETLAAKFK